MDFRAKIRSVVDDRGVEDLLHFTQAANLLGIISSGLLSRRELVKPMCSAYTSAKYRLDESDDAVSLSISRVNGAMFSSKRRKSGHSNWVILVLSPEILWTHSCRFCWCNAAKSEIKNHRGRLDGPWAFERMFSGDFESRSGLEPMFPTDPEAEVQVMERIDQKYIRGALVNQDCMVAPVQEALSALPSFFRPVVVHGY